MFASKNGSSINSVLPPIGYTEYKLANGLRVILHEDRSTPIVAVNLWYHVGSKNEVPGRTGFAHIFEHMMFQGSKSYNDDYFKPLQEAGGTLNGSTNPDRTNYWEVVPANFLELALFMEADRMGGLLEAMTEEKLNNQRDVVKNEKRQNYDNQPYGLVRAKIAETMYPPNHPYHWLTIGSLEDLTRASLEDVKDFFRRFYTPNNASLSVAGDFDPTDVRRLIEKYFGSIKPGPELQPVNAPRPRLDKEIRQTMEDSVALPRVYMTWHAVPQYTTDDAGLDMLSIVLASGKSSRLYKSLVYERQIAQDAVAFNQSGEIAGVFQMYATAKPGKTLAELEAAISEDIARIKAEPPTREEMERGYNSIESAFIYSLQTVGGFGGKSDQLNQYAVYLNKPGYFEEDLARYRRVTAADVQQAANEYLTDKRFVLTVTPRITTRPTATTDGAAEGQAQTIASPSQQTSGMTQTGASANAASQTPRTGAAPQAGQQQPTGDRPAGALEVRPKTQTDASTQAGAAPPTTTAPRASQPTPEKKAKGTASTANLPKPKPDPQFTLPRIERRRLSNNLDVLIVQHAELPIVTMNLVLKTGAAGDAPESAGLASLTADMLDEGTETRSALDISNQLAAIGARLGTGAGWDSSAAQFTTLTKHLDHAMEIYADVITNPAFPLNELNRLRDTRLAALKQRRDNAGLIADVVYASLLYGRKHPYGHPLIGDEASLGGITEGDVRRFYETYYRPNNAALVVVGDVEPEALVKKLEQIFAGWKQADVPAVNITQPPARDRATIYLVDKPGAAQSVIAIGQIGVERSTPDYFPLFVMNTLLGGQFSSRINMNLREEKGYTYGARTSFDYRRKAGPFIATAGVQTAVTKEAVVEFLKELRGIRGEMPVKEAELEFSKQAIIRGFPRGFETPEQIAGRLTEVVLYGLPDDYFNNYIERVRAVTVADVSRVASRYLDPSKMAILVVGDRQSVEPSLRTLEEVGAGLTIVDNEGRVTSEGRSDEGGDPRL
ncbi:MAG: insulinase family protein [Pyrinomonadaceae bacterium]|nr:insulinase family protein [Pyrinomonadaceae bacterium]